jgi:predicted oxidoreductase
MSTRREFLTQTAAAGVAAIAAQEVAKAQPEDAIVGQPLSTIAVPHTDLKVSRLAFGCAMLGVDWNSPEFLDKTVPVVRAALNGGIRFFDLADVYGYGKAEQALGEVLKRFPSLRHQVVIQTKCGDRFIDGGVVDCSRKHIQRSAEGSLTRLGTDYLDLYLLHWPDALVEPDEVANAFDDLHRSGKVRHFGVSNHNPFQIELLQKVVRQPLVTNQIQLGLAHWFVTPDPEKMSFTHSIDGAANLDYCRMRGIQVQAYSPLKADGIEKPPNLLNPAADATPAVKTAAKLLADLAAKNDVVPAAVMLAWLLHHPAGIVPIIGATNPKHVIEACAAVSVRLNRDEWYQLLSAATAIQPSRVT